MHISLGFSLGSQEKGKHRNKIEKSLVNVNVLIKVSSKYFQNIVLSQNKKDWLNNYTHLILLSELDFLSA